MDHTTDQKHLKKSKLEAFTIGFEYNRSVAEERKMTKKRTDQHA